MTRPTKIALGLVAFAAAIQVVALDRTNPAVTGDIVAPPEVKAVLRRACYDCHSNETVWPWYSRVAPMSWLVHRDVSQGRKHMNFSRWETLGPADRAKKQHEIGEAVADGDMPPWFYTPMHPHAALTDADRQRLVGWAGPASNGHSGGGEDSD